MLLEKILGISLMYVMFLEKFVEFLLIILCLIRKLLFLVVIFVLCGIFFVE